MHLAGQHRRPQAGIARVEARAVGGTTPDSVLTIHLSRHDPQTDPDPGEELLSSFLTAVDAGPHGDAESAAAFARGAKTSWAVAAWVGEAEAPELVVDRLMSQLVVAKTAGALVDERTCRVGFRPTYQPLDNEQHGLLLTMTSETASAPVELFPALLYCWLWWWRKQVTAGHGGPDMPSPPKHRGLDYGVQLAQWLEAGHGIAPPPPGPGIGYAGTAGAIGAGRRRAVLRRATEGLRTHHLARPAWLQTVAATCRSARPSGRGA